MVSIRRRRGGGNNTIFMAVAALSPPPPPPPLSSSSSLFSSYITQTAIFIPNTKPPKFTTLVLASSHSSPNHYPDNSHKKKSILSSLVEDIEPLDVRLIQKDVPLVTVDAMKRTISGMLGLLPSDQFQVSIDALWEPLSKLLVSSMMTGYTLRNAEYRLCFERNLEIYEGNFEKQKTEDSKCEAKGTLLNDCGVVNLPKQNDISLEDNGSDIISTIPDFGKITPEARQYILSLQSRLAFAKKELCEVKRKSAALQMQQFVGEEKNELLDYLRSLQPEKVVELSEPTSAELKETIHSVVHGLLATLSPRMHSSTPNLSEDISSGTMSSGVEEDCSDLVEDTSLSFQPLISLTRDYLARLLFWCMLLGHYLRGLEYRSELTELLSLPFSGVDDSSSGQVA
ncbi:hypothetical protein LIER_05305 [Lithospermum erythrorhizon]|uniref:MAR-binding filament-like protein 1 n=1 Tax=Lithospermum erythrorhizon TaxID=34254 RepID=A0AAV3P444_LITER